jgi:hypothetical protein
LLNVEFLYAIPDGIFFFIFFFVLVLVVAIVN